MASYVIIPRYDIKETRSNKNMYGQPLKESSLPFKLIIEILHSEFKNSLGVRSHEQE